MQTTGRSSRSLVAAVALVSALTLAGAAAGGAAKVFKSTRYQYSLVLPRSWTVLHFRGKWISGEVQPNSPATDTYSNQALSRYVIVARQGLPAGTTLDAWTQSLTQITSGDCGPLETQSVTSLGGEAADLHTYHCSGEGYYLIVVTALHRGRGYQVYLASKASDDAADGTLFARVVASWKFRR